MHIIFFWDTNKDSHKENCNKSDEDQNLIQPQSVNCSKSAGDDADV